MHYKIVVEAGNCQIHTFFCLLSACLMVLQQRAIVSQVLQWFVPHFTFFLEDEGNWSAGMFLKSWAALSDLHSSSHRSAMMRGV